MESESNNKYMSYVDYLEEWQKLGGDDFLAFLYQKIQEARKGGDYELVEHINRIYDDVLDEMSTEYIVEGGDFEPESISMLRYEESLDRFELTELQARYEAILEEIAKEERKIDEINIQIGDLDGDLKTHFDEAELISDRNAIESLIPFLQEKAMILQNKIRLEELRTNLTQMTPEEIEDKYYELSASRDAYYDDVNLDDSIVKPSTQRFFDKALELIEGHRTGNAPVFEIKEQKEENLSSLSVEELIERFNSNNQTITKNEEAIKQAIIQRILGQQQIIVEQKAEIDRLKSQKEL